MYPSTPIQALMSKAGLVLAQILLNHREKIHAYWLLILPNNHFAKKILPISFQIGDPDSIREEKQPKVLLVWASRERPSLFS